jgi:hypothetical protein
MSKFIDRRDRLIAVDHIALAVIGPLNTRGVRPARLFDDSGHDLGTMSEVDLAAALSPWLSPPRGRGARFIRIEDRLINLDRIAVAEKSGDNFKLRGSSGRELAEVDADAFLAAVRAATGEKAPSS